MHITSSRKKGKCIKFYYHLSFLLINFFLISFQNQLNQTKPKANGLNLKALLCFNSAEGRRICSTRDFPESQRIDILQIK